MTDIGLPDQVTASQKHWRDGRRHLNERRYELSQWAAQHLHADHPQIGATGLLTRTSWLPTNPVPLEDVALTWCDHAATAEIDGTEPESADVRPLRRNGQRFPTYAEALGQLARPRLFEDRPSYRLLDVAVRDGEARLSFGAGTYFDVVNVSEAVAHELADATRDTAGGAPSVKELPFRSLIDDPCDLQRRPIMPAISALTIRRTRTNAAFVLHWRDSTKVAHGGGLYQLMPVGMFQPAAAGAWNQSNDFDLWRSMAREYSEEFLGAPEYQGLDGPLDYPKWPFYRSLTDGRDAGKVTAHWLGIGIDPLSFVTDLLVVVVFDDDGFDALFGNSVATNAEGRVVREHAGRPSVAGIPFTEDRITRLATSEPMQAAGAALLRLAWQHRSTLLP
jgi:hypothetical protein